MKKIMFDDSMGAAGDMLAAALLDLFDDPDSVVQDLNIIIKDGNLEDVIAQVVKQVRDNVEGLEFDVTVDDEMEEPEDIHPHEYFYDSERPFREEFIPHRHPHPEHRHFEDHDHYREEHYHRHPEDHDHFREEHYHRRPCPHRHSEMRRPGCRRGPHPRPFEPGRPFIEGPIELHFHLHLEGDVCKKSKKKHHRHHHHHHGKHERGCRERKNRRSRRNRRSQVKKDTSLKVSKDHFN